MDETMNDRDVPVLPDEVKEEEIILANKLINEEYKIWKKNSVFLYDMFYGRALEWPTLTTQWLPDKKPVEGTNLSVHRAILGTHTSNGAQNYLQIAHIEIPDNRTPASAELNERGEVGGYANAKRPFEFKIVQNINHPGDVNKARYQPQNPDIIATHCEDGRVLIFDRTKHPLQPKNDSSIKCEAELVGHEDQGFGLAWSPLETGHLVTGTQDTTVRTWDLKSGFSKDTKTVSPTATYKYHSATVNDVQYHPSYPLIGTASDDLTWTVIDTRVSSQKPPTFRKQAHDDAVNCIAFHPEFECLFVTGSSDKTISMWDLRNTNQKLHSFQGSNGAISSLQWQPQDVCILASSSDDRRIRYWDISKTGEEQTPEEAEDGPSELIFMHGGFTDRIADLDFNKNEPWLTISAADDNQLQIFRPARKIVEPAPKKTVHAEVSE